MKNDKTDHHSNAVGAESNTDDLVMDSMLRQFVNSEVRRFSFAERINSAIRKEQSSDLVTTQQDDTPSFDSEVVHGAWSNGRGSLYLRYGQIAAIAGAIFLALWLPNRQSVPEQDVAKTAGAEAATNLEPKTSVTIATNSTVSSTVNSSNESSGQAAGVAGAVGSLEQTDAIVKQEDLPSHLPIRSELVIAGDSLKIVRSTGDSSEAKVADVEVDATQLEEVEQQDQEESAHPVVFAQRAKQIDSDVFPTRKLTYEFEVNSRSKSVSVSFNGKRLAKKIRCQNLAQGLKLLEPELSRRIRFVEPRVGNIHGSLEYKSEELRFGLDFENERQLRSAFTRVCKRLEKFGKSSSRNLKRTSSPDEFLGLALKKADEDLRLWAKEVLEMGNVSLEPDFESRSRFQRVISQESLKRFAESGYFKIPEPEKIYLASTQLQFLKPGNLRRGLASSTRKLDLFQSKEEMQQFVDAYKSKSRRSGSGRGNSKEPLKEILEQRDDLRGLPLVMGDDCHMDRERSMKMDEVSRTVGPILNRFDRFASRNVEMHPVARQQILNQQIQHVKQYFSRTSDSPQSLLTIDQMLQIEDPDMRIELVKLLEESRSQMSAALLASYAKFDLSPEVRILATSALSGFPKSYYQKKLVEGMRYPWPEAAKHTAEALVRLNEVEAIPVLVDMLKEPDPRRPVQHGAHYVKRELVAINHLKNCMLCHADSQSGGDKGQAPVPMWETELPRTYYNFRSPGLLMARADVTYMRQDFSVVQEVVNAKPWPKHQRFDYVVQQRKLTKQQYDELIGQQTADSNTYEQAIVFALRMLTGETPADNSYETWNAIAEQMPVLP